MGRDEIVFWMCTSFFFFFGRIEECAMQRPGRMIFNMKKK